MSVTMDSQDLRGSLRGICLILVVRVTGRAFTRADIDRVLHGEYARDVDLAIASVAAFTGLSATFLKSAVEELLEADDEYLLPENLNMQLGLLSGQPFPIFPFVQESRVDQTAMLRPLIDTAKKLVHAAVRLRMQSLPSASAQDFWYAITQFLLRVGGNDEVAAALALSTIADVISDLLFFNTDASSRTNDSELAARMTNAVAELRTVSLSEVARTLAAR